MTIRRLLCLMMLPAALGGCGDHSMTQQNRYGTFTKAALFKDGTEAQVPPKGAIAQGELGPVGGQNFIHGFTASVVLFDDG